MEPDMTISAEDLATLPVVSVRTNQTERGGVHGLIVFANGYEASILHEPESGFAGSYGVEMRVYRPGGEPMLSGIDGMSEYDGGIIPWIENGARLFELLQQISAL